jgi:threonine dehydrogenase-like Zn-dependent dehydrogenase
VLINGASGGVGTFALQLARTMGLRTTAVVSPRNADQAQRLGASHVIDYTARDFTRCGHRYDIVIDLVGNRRLRDLPRCWRRGPRRSGTAPPAWSEARHWSSGSYTERHERARSWSLLVTDSHDLEGVFGGLAGA